MEDPDTQDKPTSVPLNALAIQAQALEKAGIPTALADIISRAGGTGGLQKFVINEAHGIWNNPTVLGQLWHGIRLWCVIKFVLFAVAVIRVLPVLLLSAFLLGSGAVAIALYIAANSSKTASATTATVPYHGASIDLSAVSEVQTGTKLTYTSYTTPVTGEVTAKTIDSVSIKWEYDNQVKFYSYEQLARDLASGRIVINRD